MILIWNCPFPHHYQGRIDFNTVNPCHSTGMDLVSIPAGRVVLANPVPRAKIFQYSPCRGLSTHPLQGECWKILSLGIGLENPVSRDRIGQYYPAGRDGQQIHPRRVVLIDSVKINPSLVMMRECAMCIIKRP